MPVWFVELSGFDMKTIGTLRVKQGYIRDCLVEQTINEIKLDNKTVSRVVKVLNREMMNTIT